MSILKIFKRILFIFELLSTLFSSDFFMTWDLFMNLFTFASELN